MKLNPFKGLGLKGRRGENRLTLLVEGNLFVLYKLKDYLTLKNESIGYKIKKAKESVIFWEIRKTQEQSLDMDIEYSERKLDQISIEIKELQEEYIQVFYEEVEGGLIIPAGFWYVCDFIEDNIHINNEIKPYHIDGARDYQIEAVEEALKYKRSTIVLPTGAGKSFVILNIALSFVKKDKRVFIVVPTEYLVGQVYDTIKPHWDSITAIGGKRKHPKLGSDIFVCTAQSAIKYADGYHVIIVDESQHSPASTWLNLMTSTHSADYCYNLTATPFRADGMDLAINAFGGPIVFERDVRWGINSGWLSPCKIYLATIQPKDKSGLPMIFSDSTMAASVYKKMITNKEVFSYLEGQIKRMLDAGKKIIVIFKTVQPGLAFRKYCKGRVVFDVADSKFKKPLDDFRNGLTQILVSNSSLISEGIDIPNADVLFLLTQHGSEVISYQSIGRVLRKSPGKEYAIVVDIMTPGYSQFEKAREKRLKVFKKITDEVIVIGGKK